MPHFYVAIISGFFTKWGLDYNAHDFVANGEELVPWNVDVNGNGEYRAQINEHFTRYEFDHDTGWVVTRKNGKKYYYGIDIESREDTSTVCLQYTNHRVLIKGYINELRKGR